MRLTCARVFSAVAFAGLLCSPAALTPLAAQGPSADANGRRLAQFNGLTAGEWLALWWQDQLGTPVVTGGAVDRKNGLRFLGAPLTPPGTPTVTVAVTVSGSETVTFPLRAASVRVLFRKYRNSYSPVSAGRVTVNRPEPAAPVKDHQRSAPFGSLARNSPTQSLAEWPAVAVQCKGLPRGVEN